MARPLMRDTLSKVNEAGFLSRRNKKGKYKIHELLKPSATKLYRYIKIKGKANPFNPEYREYFEMRRLLSNTVAI